MLDERYKTELVADLCDYVRIPSRSSAAGGDEGVLQIRIAEQMRAAGARVEVREVDSIPGFYDHPLCHGRDRQYQGRPTVIGEIGPEDAPALLLLAHSDTVPLFEPAQWTFDPFCGELRDGNVYGLGASDDKWGLATLLTLLRVFAETPLPKRLIFASTIDEENGVGNGALLLTLTGVQAEAALYLDGADMQICTGNLGGSNLYLRPRVPLTPEVLVQDTERIKAMCVERSRRRASLYDGSYFADDTSRERSVVYRPDRNAQGPFHIINFYMLPGEEREAYCQKLEEHVRLALGESFAHYALSYREPWFEPASVPRTTPLVGYLSDAYRNILHSEPCITTISKQDAFVLTNHAHIPTVSFGPAHSQGKGGYHKPDEYVNLEKVWQCACVAYAALCRWLAQESA